ncbi:hypothetical protein [Nodularia spumigena]|jgi:hypothetical protein|nr:hypothetical protein [Nodularia spumigena]AHJ31507.1 hypothetical protein NSP_52190 [Nodularia spumigena CCY9414]MDB9337657.1 hypothetical protein [Nodularia spumigena CS-589/07]MDB9399512.1 hypothetical protein [Microcystis aeruginosa CS-567/02-A1]MEA5558863.1 hypothetical protein [Nodularia spumigena CH309]
MLHPDLELITNDKPQISNYLVTGIMSQDSCQILNESLTIY